MHAMTTSGEPAPPKLQPVKEAARLLGLGPTKTNELIRDGLLKSIKVGKRRLVLNESIDDFIAARLVSAA
jgi:excisionase family DNA binding protein